MLQQFTIEENDFESLRVTEGKVIIQYRAGKLGPQMIELNKAIEENERLKEQNEELATSLRNCQSTSAQFYKLLQRTLQVD